MAPHTWSHLGDTVSDTTHHMYYRGQRIKEAYYRGECIWREEDSELIISFIADYTRITSGTIPTVGAEIIGENLSYSLNGGPHVPFNSGFFHFTSPIIQDVFKGNLVTISFYGKNVTLFRFAAVVNGVIGYNSTENRTITEILTPFGKNCEKITSFAYLFRGCTSLKKLPKHLFANTPDVTDFTQAFRHCTSLESIPDDLFEGTHNVRIFRECFDYCIRLKAIPDDLFGCTSKVTDLYLCFQSCRSLKTLPENLFRSMTDITEFRSVFVGCEALKDIPTNLFANNFNVVSFAGCFKYTYSLEHIPESLFEHNSKATNFNECFRECRILDRIPERLFDNVSSIEYISSCFNGCASLEGDVPRLWERFQTSKHFNCFRGCTKTANYSEIPSDWK